MSGDAPHHHCPGCGASVTAFLRYPWHFCMDCSALTTDGAGRRLEFFNASLSGGLVWRLVGEERLSDEVLAVRCLIHGRPVLVTEARFGGVAVQPDLAGRGGIDVTDLTGA